MTNPDNATSGPASDAPAPPREKPWRRDGETIEEFERRRDAVYLAWQIEDAKAASPAQEATPPRCGSERADGVPCKLFAGHPGQHGNPLIDGAWVRWPDAPLSNASRAVLDQRGVRGGVYCNCFDPECGYPHGSNRLGHVTLPPAAPAREASTAPEPESFDDLLNRYGIACCDHGASVVGSVASEEAMERRHDLWQRLRATVAALTAAAATLATFAETAPGRPPQRVQDAIAAARATPEAGEVPDA